MLGLALLEREDYGGGIKELEKVSNYIITMGSFFSLEGFFYLIYTLFSCLFIVFVIYLQF